MGKKAPMQFSKKFPNGDPLALCLLEKLLAFDPKDRPSAVMVGFTLKLWYMVTESWKWLKFAF
jgi:serine/threonine protein kinase